MIRNTSRSLAILMMPIPMPKSREVKKIFKNKTTIYSKDFICIPNKTLRLFMRLFFCQNDVKHIWQNGCVLYLSKTFNAQVYLAVKASTQLNVSTHFLFGVRMHFEADWLNHLNVIWFKWLATYWFNIFWFTIGVSNCMFVYNEMKWH